MSSRIHRFGETSWQFQAKEKKAKAGKPAVGQDAAGQLVPFGSVRFWPPGHPDHAVTVPMGSHGFALDRQDGWDTVQRPNGPPITVWRGAPGLEATVEVIFERWDTNDSVRPAWELLEGQMNQGPKPVTGFGNPAVPIMVTVGAANSKVTSPQDDKNRWVITGIDVDEDATVHDANDNPVRIEAVVSLALYLAPTALQHSATAIRNATNGARRRKPYKAHAGDTLIKIAASQLHDRSRWQDLQKLNPKIRDPRQKIKAGTVIRLP